MKKPLVILGVILTLCLFACFAFWLFVFGPLDPTNMEINQHKADTKEALTDACNNIEINESLRKDYVCKLIDKNEGCNNSGASACTDIYSPNWITPKFLEFGIDNKLQIFARGSDVCLGPCGGDGGEFEHFAVSYGNNILGYLRIFTNEKNTDQVVWRQVDDNIYFYLYDASSIGYNTTSINVVFKYDIKNNQFFASEINTRIPNENFNSVSFDESLNLVEKNDTDFFVLTPTNFVLQDPEGVSTGGLFTGYLSNVDSYTAN